eukprot:364502-Chlamydomonas_euryale.AAC.8
MPAATRRLDGTFQLRTGARSNADTRPERAAHPRACMMSGMVAGTGGGARAAPLRAARAGDAAASSKPCGVPSLSSAPLSTAAPSTTPATADAAPSAAPAAITRRATRAAMFVARDRADLQRADVGMQSRCARASRSYSTVTRAAAAAAGGACGFAPRPTAVALSLAPRRARCGGADARASSGSGTSRRSGAPQCTRCIVGSTAAGSAGMSVAMGDGTQRSLACTCSGVCGRRVCGRAPSWHAGGDRGHCSGDAPGCCSNGEEGSCCCPFCCGGSNPCGDDSAGGSVRERCPECALPIPGSHTSPFPGCRPPPSPFPGWQPPPSPFSGWCSPPRSPFPTRARRAASSPRSP